VQLFTTHVSRKSNSVTQAYSFAHFLQASMLTPILPQKYRLLDFSSASIFIVLLSPSNFVKTLIKCHTTWIRVTLRLTRFKTAIEFSAILFLLFSRSSSNSPRFRQTLSRNFNWIRQQMKNFPITPIVKSARFRQLHNVAESRQFLQWGSTWKFFTRCRI